MRNSKKVFFLVFLLWTFVCGVSTSSYAAVPHLLNYQGKLTDQGGNPLNGSYNLTFRIYDAETAGNMLWEEIQSGVVIQNGLFSVLLGQVTAMNLAFDKAYFLEIKVGSEVMTPRQRIPSSGYAIRAETAEKSDTADKIKVDLSDPLYGYLSDKADSLTLEVDTATHKIRVKDNAISKTKLKTAIGEISHSDGTTIGNLILPGGEYGFYPQIKKNPSGVLAVCILGGGASYPRPAGATYTSSISIYTEGSGTGYAQQRYVTASGRDYWIFVLTDKSTGEIVSSWSAPDHPSYGNGGDSQKVPQPFGDYDSTKYEITILDKDTCNLLKQESEKTGKSILTLINEDYRPDLANTEKYQPLHSGAFLDKEPVMIQDIPDYIKVRKVIKLLASEKLDRENKISARKAAADNLKQLKAQRKDSARTKLSALGLTKEEIGVILKE